MLIPVCFGVYLIHDNMTVSYYLLGDRFAFLAEQNPLIMVGGVILAGVGIFVVCSLIDWVRELLFRKLRIKDRLCRIEQKLSSGKNI